MAGYYSNFIGGAGEFLAILKSMKQQAEEKGLPLPPDFEESWRSAEEAVAAGLDPADLPVAPPDPETGSTPATPAGGSRAPGSAVEGRPPDSSRPLSPQAQRIAQIMSANLAANNADPDWYDDFKSKQGLTDETGCKTFWATATSLTEKGERRAAGLTAEGRYVLEEENAERIAGWLKDRGGVLIWQSVNPANPGGSWATPYLTEDGKPHAKPTYEAGDQPVHLTDPALVDVSTAREVKRLRVGLMYGDGTSTLVPAGAWRRIRHEVEKAACGKEGATWHTIDCDHQEVVIWAEDRRIPLPQWLAERGKVGNRL